MASLLYRLGKTAYSRWPLFLAGWLVILAAVAFAAGSYSKPMVDSFSIPGIPSEKASDLQGKLFGQENDAFEEPTVTIAVKDEKGLDLHENRLNALVKELKALPQTNEEGMAALASPLSASKELPKDSPMSPLSEDGTVGTMTFTFDAESPMEVKPETLEAFESIMEDFTEDGLQVEANGNGMSGSVELGYTSELIGIGIALLVLILTFGSLVSAGLPIINAIVGVALGMTSITAATAFLDINSSTPMLATMIGLAVGIDYSLFILARYRNELHHSKDRAHATGLAVGTAGSAVVFAGLTVIIALSALLVVRIPFLSAMGLAAALTVFIAVLASLTLLPAILGMLKSKAFAGQVRKNEPKRDRNGLVENNGLKFAKIIQGRPATFLAAGVLLLTVLAIPVTGLFLAFPTDSTKPGSTTQRQASDIIAEGFGPGREAPLLVIVDLSKVTEADRIKTLDAMAADLGEKANVKNAFVAATNSQDPQNKPNEATGGIITIIPDTGPNDNETVELLTDLRENQGKLEESTNTTVGVTGLTAITTDVSERLQNALIPYLAVVVGLAFLLLLIVFRSIVVPLTATLGFLLSVLATLGVTVAVFQEGMFGIMSPQPIVSFMPIILIGIIFGLAMDYQVFLTSRMKEAHSHGLTAREAILDGFRNSARVVVAAATIMIAVFAAFMLQPDPIIKSMGFALAIAIVLDAFVVRMMLVPAILFLLDEKAWLMPAFLDRILPKIDVEGENLEKPAWHLED